jgi:lysophospholipase L1-like esterase
MKTPMKASRSIILRSLVVSALLVPSAWAVETNSAVVPAPRPGAWIQRHEGFVEIAKKGGVEVLFLGDSITDFWRNTGKPVWEQNFAARHAANFGISADRTQHVLWRMDHGELDGIKPKVVILMIGTNNCGFERDGKTPRNATPEVIEGVTAVVKEIRAQLPKSKILLLGIFPRAEKGAPIRDQIKEVNAAIAKLDDGKYVRFLDIGPKFLEPDGTLSREIMPDLLHPSAKGYQIWADAIKEPLAELLK